MDRKVIFKRFMIVGVLNTLIDVVVFVFLRSLSIGVVLANMTSTSVALIFSFVMNSTYTFKADREVRTKGRLVLFVAVTLFGLWVVQPIIIQGVVFTADHYPPLHTLLNVFASEGGAVSNTELIPKLVAIAVTLFWNYVWYSRVIFTAPHEKSEATNEHHDKLS